MNQTNTNDPNQARAAGVYPTVRILGTSPPAANAVRNAEPAPHPALNGRVGLAALAYHALQEAGNGLPLSVLQDEPFRAVMEGMLTTSDFPETVQEIVNRLAVRQLGLVPPWIRTIGRRIEAVDFREHVAPMLGDPELKKLNESGEIEFASLPEKGERFRISTYAARSAWTRQLAVNDIDGSFERAITTPMGSVNNLEANIATDLLAANAGLGPVMSDGDTLFHANHGNAGTGVLDVAGLDVGRKAMRTQKALDGKNPISVGPKFLMVPAALETTAEQVLAALQPTKTADVNPFQNKLELVVEPRLDALSATVWYLFADPAMVPTVGYVYLRGQNGPMVEIKPSWEQDGLGIRIVHDFGVVAEDWRGSYRSTGV